MIDDYSFLNMEELPSDKKKWDEIMPKYDYFISAFTIADRVREVFNLCKAKKKHWLVFSEYNFEEDKPTETELEKVCILTQTHKGSLTEIRNWWNGLQINNTASLCIDATGFLRPTLLFLMRLLDNHGIKKYDVLYAEPNWYVRHEHTNFSEDFTDVEPIPSFGGSIDFKQNTRGLLIIAAGYEDKLISEVAEKYKASEKVLIYGFPPLRADMFQESILRLCNTEQVISEYNANDVYFAPANDPFTTANTLRKIIKNKTGGGQDYNIYLSPLSTKPQVLGFGLFYIAEKRDKTPCSIVFPFANKYTRESTKGIGRIWRYTIEIPE